MRTKIHFRDHHEDGFDTLTLWVEKELPMDDGTVYLLGWCPERKNNIVVHPDNVVRDEVTA